MTDIAFCRIGQLRTQTARRDAALAPSFDEMSDARRCGLAGVLDFTQPAARAGLEPQDDAQFGQGEAAISAFLCETIRGGHGRDCSDDPNISSSAQIRMVCTDESGVISDHANMAKPDETDWYLRDWFDTAGLKQRDLVTKLDYPPATANALWHGVQRYRRDHVQQISALLNIEPFELLMHPADAMALRRLRSVVAEVAKADQAAAADTAEPRPPRTGTEG